MALGDDIVAYWKLDGNSEDAVGSNDGTDTDISVILSSYPESNFDTNTYTLISSSRTRAGVVFSTSVTDYLHSCKFYLKKNAGETGNAVAYLFAESGGTPTGSVLATSNNFDVSTLSDSSFSLAEFIFPSGQNYQLQNGTNYCLEIRFSGSNGILMGLKFTTGGFNFTYDGSYATDTNRKLCFYVNATAYTTGNGKINQGAGFNGTTSKIVGSAVNIPTNATISCWFKSSNSPDYATIFGFQKSGAIHPRFYLRTWTWSTGKIRGALSDSDGVGADIYYDSEGVLNDGNWHHAVLVKTGSSIELFVDNVSKGTDSDTFTGNFESAIMQMGTEPNTPAFYSGAVDECAYWSRALTSDEVSQLYNSGNGNQYPFSTIYNAIFTLGSYAITTLDATIGRPVRNAIFTLGEYTVTTYDATVNKIWSVIFSLGQYIITTYSAIIINTSWRKKTKPTTSWSNKTKPTTSWTEKTKPSTTWTNKSKP